MGKRIEGGAGATVHASEAHQLGLWGLGSGGEAQDTNSACKSMEMGGVAHTADLTCGRSNGQGK